MKPYQFHPDAEAEFLAQRDYYDSCEAGLEGWLALPLLWTL